MSQPRRVSPEEYVARARRLLTCPLEDPRTAAAFAEHCRVETWNNIQKFTPFFVLVVVVTWPFDILLEPAMAGRIAAFRASCVAFGSVYAWGFSRYAALRARPWLSTTGVLWLTILGCLALGDRAALSLPWVDQVYLLPFVTLLGLGSLGRRTAYTLGLAGAMLGVYFLAFPAERASVNAWPFVITMTLAALISVTMGHVIHFLSWRGFVLAERRARANDELERRVAQQTGELRELTDRERRVHESERARLARALGVETRAQIETLRGRLGALGATPAFAAASARARRLIDQLDESTARLLANLGPVQVSGGLGHALRRLAETVDPKAATPTGAAPRTRVEVDASLDALDPALARALFRVAQEAMTNALRHAQARRIELYARRDDQRVHLEIRDDGIGFDPTTKSGFGLASMRERAELLGADLAIESAPGEGTTVTLVGPLAGSTR
ncbi:MAG: ATP-binding protein [Myxococcales bacterium]|nr:ATP-binding protein [Myxococcales bacterium]